MLAQQFSGLPAPAWGLLVLPLVLLGRWWRPAWILAALLAGIFWLGLRAEPLLQQRLPAAVEGRDLVLEGVVEGLPRRMERGSRFRFRVERASFRGRTVAVPRRVLLRAYHEWKPAWRPGDRWRLTARLKRPRGFQNPGGLDYEAYLFRQGLRARGYVRRWPPPEYLGPARGHAVDRLRQKLGARVRQHLGGRPLAGLLTALATGDRQGIVLDQWRLLQATGTSHLMAISGLHIGLVAGLTFLLASRLWALPGTPVLRWPAPVAGAVAAMAAAAGYAALAGFAIPTQRALIMLAVVMAAVLARRRLLASNVLALALLAVLLHDPLAVMDAGFWLSFGAVALIGFVLLGRSGEGRWRRFGRVQWGLSLGLFPLLLFFFQQASLVAPLANLVMVPVFALFVVPATLLGALALLILPPAVAVLPLQAALGALEALWPWLEWIGRQDLSLWRGATPPWWALLCAAAGTLLLLAPRGWPGRWPGVIWLLPLFLWRPPAPAQGELWFTLLDVGQGLAAVVRTAGHTLVYDTGPRFSPRFDTGRSVLVPYLRTRGVERIDTLIVSHGDNDHMGGAASLRALLPVGRVLSSVPARLKGARPCRAGERWRWDGVEFEILNPDPAGPSWLNGNNRSCVLQIRSAYGRVLLPGDIEAETELRLVREQGAGLASELLVVPHHGSRTSSTDRFLDRVDPRLAFLPVGYRNRYRHPHPTVRARYARRGVKLYSSPAHGALEVRMTPQGIAVQAYRQHRRRYWFDD